MSFSCRANFFVCVSTYENNSFFFLSFFLFFYVWVFCDDDATIGLLGGNLENSEVGIYMASALDLVRA